MVVVVVVVVVVFTPKSNTFVLKNTPNQWKRKTPKPFLPLGAHKPPPNTLSLNRLHSPPQMASGSNQPCCHSTLSGQTDRPRVWIGDNCVPRAHTLYYIDRERCTNKTSEQCSWCREKWYFNCNEEVTFQPFHLSQNNSLRMYKHYTMPMENEYGTCNEGRNTSMVELTAL